jgi:hypothetical protein
MRYIAHLDENPFAEIGNPLHAEESHMHMQPKFRRNGRMGVEGIEGTERKAK